jgi:hypothetical protein
MDISPRLPCYPLLTLQPNFSFYVQESDLTEGEPSDWIGHPKAMLGLLSVGGKTYRFLGKDTRFPALKQTGLKLGLLTSEATYEGPGFELKVCFLTPHPLDDPALCAVPVAFVDYKVVFQGAPSALSIVFAASASLVYFHPGRIRGDSYPYSGGMLAYCGLDQQSLLGPALDFSSPDAGYVYLAGPEAGYLSEGEIPSLFGLPKSQGEERWVYAKANPPASKLIQGHFLFGYDEVASLFYYGDFLRNPTFQNGKTIVSLFSEMEERHDEIVEHCASFEKRTFADAAPLGEDYRVLLIASYRQALASHQWAKDRQGRLLLVSRENSSGGCAATVDVSYPSLPLFLYYQPSLVFSLLYPILDFARCSVWDFPFAPHDAGIYPYCTGQFYGLKEGNPEGRKWEHAYLGPEGGVLPPFYLYPSGEDLYDEKRQMPVEECSDVLIMAYLASRDSKQTAFLKEYAPELKKWADYLLKAPVFPRNQLTSDDFLGPSEEDVNLAIKRAVGLACYGASLGLLKEKDDRYQKMAKESAKTIESLVPGGFLPNAPTRLKETGLKYNLFADRMARTGLFKEATFNKENQGNLARMLPYGSPLRSGSPLCKSDWLLWSAACCSDPLAEAPYFASLRHFLEESKEHAPFSDLFDASNGEIRVLGEGKDSSFIARPVQAGCFAPLYGQMVQSGKEGIHD